MKTRTFLTAPPARRRICTAMFSTLALSLTMTGAAGADQPLAGAAPVARAVPPAIARSTEAQRESWRQRLLRTPRAKNTCYQAIYPDTQWHETPCIVPPKHYFGPKHGPPRDVVGNGDDNVAEPSNPITLAEGSFDKVVATSISTTGATPGEGVNGPNLFTLQLNSNFFSTSVCSGISGCLGFAQFVYDNSVPGAYIQYWLVGHGPGCPGGWTQLGGDCVQNASTGVPAPMGVPLTVNDLYDTKVTGSGAAGGSITLYVGGYMKSAPGDGIIPDLTSNWGDAEFNVFGDGGSGQALFGPNSTLVVRTQVDTNINILPDCIIGGWTAETNSLDLASTPTVVPKKQYPSVVFDESNDASSSPASCSTSIGDTHVTTFDGLYYNFQAAGDFVLADTGPDFIVQGRQESGAQAFRNPNVTVNTAVAVQMGQNRVGIYDSPAHIVINGKTTDVADNGYVSLAGGVYVLHLGNVYLVTRGSGEMVRAHLYSGWMDISVGLGHRPRSSAHGILASPSRTALSTRDGTDLKEPVSTGDLYQRYAPSWVVSPNESLFENQTVKYVAPAKTFVASSLEPQVYAKARGICAAAGVDDPTLLDSCTLDAAVLDDTVAVRAFGHAILPRITLKPVEGAVNVPRE